MISPAQVIAETTEDLIAWYGGDLPCQRWVSKHRCPNPGAWWVLFECGHAGALCEEHYEDAEQQLRDDLTLHWLCGRGCKTGTRNLRWRRL